MGRLTGKVALVSGAARGQGRSHAQMLAAEGADIIAVDICADIESNEYPLAKPEDLEETGRLVEKEGRRAFTEIADVRDRASLSAVIDRAVEEFGQLDVVVANAGIAPLTAGSGIQAFIDAVDVDLVGVLNLVHASIKHLHAGASIVITGSMAAALSASNSGGIDAGCGGAGYGFAKQIVAHYVNDLALQLAPQSIRVNAVHPTNVNTDMLHSARCTGPSDPTCRIRPGRTPRSRFRSCRRCPFRTSSPKTSASWSSSWHPTAPDTSRANRLPSTPGVG